MESPSATRTQPIRTDVPFGFPPWPPTATGGSLDALAQHSSWPLAPPQALTLHTQLAPCLCRAPVCSPMFLLWFTGTAPRASSTRGAVPLNRSLGSPTYPIHLAHTSHAATTGTATPPPRSSHTPSTANPSNYTGSDILVPP